MAHSPQSTTESAAPSLIADPLQIAEEWHRQGRTVALATVVETWGSAPRPTGSHWVIDQDGHFEGSVSGGCVEGAVVTEALDCLENDSRRIVTFGYSDDEAFAVGLTCGGTIHLYLEPLDW